MKIKERKVTVKLDAFSKAVHDRCQECRASYWELIQVNPDICKLAELELRMGKTPTVADAIENKIGLDNILEKCPNKYLSSGEISLRRI